jgi:hypothetical protein
VSGEATRVADELEIRNLLAELAWLADHAPIDDLTGYLACFTDDAEWEMPGDTRRGHAQLQSGAEDRRRSGTMGPGSGVMHFLGCTHVAFSSDTEAHAKSYMQAYRDTSGEPKLMIMGEYRDTFRKTDAGWKLAKRVVQFGS